MVCETTPDWCRKGAHARDCKRLCSRRTIPLVLAFWWLLVDGAGTNARASERAHTHFHCIHCCEYGLPRKLPRLLITDAHTSTRMYRARTHRQTHTHTHTHRSYWSTVHRWQRARDQELSQPPLDLDPKPWPANLRFLVPWLFCVVAVGENKPSRCSRESADVHVGQIIVRVMRRHFSGVNVQSVRVHVHVRACLRVEGGRAS